jgi:hypothetical protein
MADQLLIRTVRHLKDVFRPTSTAKNAGACSKRSASRFHLTLLLTPSPIWYPWSPCRPPACRRSSPVRGVDRTVAVGPIDVFQPAISIDGHELILMPACLAPRHHRFDLRVDDRPDFRPAILTLLPQGRRMLALAEAGPVSVVIKLDKVFAPHHRNIGWREFNRVLTGSAIPPAIDQSGQSRSGSNQTCESDRPFRPIPKSLLAPPLAPPESFASIFCSGATVTWCRPGRSSWCGRTAARLVDALVGVGAEVVALGLEQVGGQPGER